MKTRIELTNRELEAMNNMVYGVATDEDNAIMFKALNRANAQKNRDLIEQVKYDVIAEYDFTLDRKPSEETAKVLALQILNGLSIHNLERLATVRKSGAFNELLEKVVSDYK